MAFITVDELQVLIEVKAGEFSSNQNRRSVHRRAEMENAFVLLQEREYIVLENNQYILSGFGEQFVELLCHQNLLNDIWWPHRPIGEYDDVGFRNRFRDRQVSDHKNNINIVPMNNNKNLTNAHDEMADLKDNLNSKPRDYGSGDIDG